MSISIQLIGLAAALSVAAPGFVSAQSARDYISIVGSSSVYPFASLALEQFGKTTKYKTPTVESTGYVGEIVSLRSGQLIGAPGLTPLHPHPYSVHSVSTEGNANELDAICFVRDHRRLWYYDINSVDIPEQREPAECGSDRTVNYRPAHNRYRVNEGHGPR